MTWLAVVFALAGAATAAVSTSAQHHAASSAPAGTGPGALLRHLVRRPAWLAALLLGPLGFTLHVLALRHGPIGLVQPLLITGLVFAVPLRAALARTWPATSELVAVSVTAGGIAVLLLASETATATAAPDPAVLGLSVAATAGVAVLLLLAGGSLGRSATSAFLLGCSSGLLFALMAVLIKAVQLHGDAHGTLATATTWLPYALAGCGVGGIAVNQLAYRAARLSASMPALNVVNCLVALGLGHAVFHESLTTGPMASVVAAAALAAMGWGLWSLSRSGSTASGRDRRPRRRTSSRSSREAPSAPARAASGC
ncbi:DMT family transporter [Nocardioides stalactiti]|uniref:DMT family transporter n=1 Tax=Nocardioides stalactiti TaxID=2755356 RepID=UPI00160144FD|nr:DMT family transporter [Nocardioides stalactiti]